MSDHNPAPVALGHFADETHALRTGLLIGTLMKAGIHIRPETDDDGNYLSRIAIELPPLEELAPPVEIWIKVLSGPGAL